MLVPLLALIQVLELVVMFASCEKRRNQYPIQYTARELILAFIEIGIVSIIWTFYAVEVNLVSKFSDFADLFVEIVDRTYQLLCLHL